MMRNKPELLVTAASLEELKLLLEAGANAFLLGESQFGLRLPGEFKPEQLKAAVAAAHAQAAKVYVAVNQIMDNSTVHLLPDYLSTLGQLGVDAIVFGDPAVLMAARTYAPDSKLHWNAEMTATNYATANFWGRKGAHRVVLARELNMEQVIAFKANATIEVEVQVHGMTNIYHAKRKLVNSYTDYRKTGRGLAIEELHSELPADLGQGLFLIESERQEERFPVFEDDNGTHIMSSDDICMLENLPELIDAGVDSLKIEGLLKSTAYNTAVVRAYRTVIDAYCADPDHYSFDEQLLSSIEALQDPHRELSFGFFYKEQVY